ncbi:repetitive organellar protein-like [Aedes albopictus]|uniref:Uncharacterized protein n=1 Tax=Aedes albopictus TaxID=7160 RepID=A0ABM1Y1D9_AEDAL
MAFSKYSQRDRFFRELRDRLERESEEEREYEEEDRVDKPRGNNNNYYYRNNNYSRNNNNYNHNNNYNQNDNYYNHRETNEEENGLRMEVEKYKKLWKDTEEKMLLIANAYQRVIKSLLKRNSDAISNNKTAMEAEKHKELWEQSEESKARLEELYHRDIKDLHDDRRDAANDMAAKENKFDNKLKALEAKLSDEIILNEALSQEVTMLKMREEELALSVADNKTAINSELESKESEVRELKVQLESNKKNMEEALTNRDILRNEVNDLQDKLTATEEKVKNLDSTISLTVTTCNKQKNELESQFVEFEQKTLDLEKENHNMKTVIINLEQEKSDISSKFVEFERKILDLEKENHLMKTVIINLEQQKSDLNKHLPESIDKSEKLLSEKDTLSTKVQELEENSKCFSSYEKVTSFKGPIDNFCVIKEETQNKLTSPLKQLKNAHAEKAVSEYRNTKTRLKLQQLQETTYDNENFFQEPQSQIKQQESAHAKEEATIASLAKRKDFEPLGNLLNEIDLLRDCVFSENYECLTELLWDDHG